MSNKPPFQRQWPSLADFLEQSKESKVWLCEIIDINECDPVHSSEIELFKTRKAAFKYLKERFPEERKQIKKQKKQQGKKLEYYNIDLEDYLIILILKEVEE